MNILIVDNYDSFTYNLYDLIYRASGFLATVIKNDAMTYAAFAELSLDCIILSPGPGHPGRPKDLGISLDIVKHSTKPILGICLGHQGIAHAFGGTVMRAPTPVHGFTEAINHEGVGLFDGIPQRVKMVRYHSLIVEDKLPTTMRATAWTDEGLVMGIQHNSRMICGIQFHPESICSEGGETLIKNFLKMVKDES